MEDKESTSGTMRSLYSRLAGVGLLGTLIAILLEHGVGQSIGGASLYGVRDAAEVAAFYGHPTLRTVYWLCTALLPFFVLFAIAFRGYVNSFGYSIASDIFFAMMIVEAPLLLAHIGLNIALVDFMPTNEPNTLLGVFAAMDGIYNDGLEIIEVWWMGALAIASWRFGALPRWLAGWAAVAAIGLEFNYVARYLRLPEGTLMPTYALFALWMLTTGIVLLKGSTKK